MTHKVHQSGCFYESLIWPFLVNLYVKNIPPERLEIYTNNSGICHLLNPCFGTWTNKRTPYYLWNMIKFRYFEQQRTKKLVNVQTRKFYKTLDNYFKFLQKELGEKHSRNSHYIFRSLKHFFLGCKN